MKKSAFRKVTPGWVAVYVVMTAFVLFMALPLVYMVTTAFKPLDEILLFPPRFFVRRPILSNFADLLASVNSKYVPLSRSLFNSVLTTTLSVGGSVVICGMGAYAVEKVRMKGSKVLFTLVVSALMFSPPAAQIPVYIAVSSMGMIDTYWALIIPSIAGKPIYFFLMKQFLSQMPDALVESVRIDGAGEFTIFWKVAMPIIKPAWSTVLVLAFIDNWNNAGGSIVYITKQQMKTLPYALTNISANISTGDLSRAGAAAAAALIITLPTIIVFVIMQSRVMNTMAYAGIKG